MDLIAWLRQWICCQRGDHRASRETPVVNAVAIGTKGTLRSGDTSVRICEQCRVLYMRREGKK